MKEVEYVLDLVSRHFWLVGLAPSIPSGTSSRSAPKPERPVRSAHVSSSSTSSSAEWRSSAEMSPGICGW
jgi:hypothetical protein